MHDPKLAVAEAKRMTMQSGMYLSALLAYEAFAFRCQKLRQQASYTEREGRKPPSPGQLRMIEAVGGLFRRLWGSVEVVEFLRTQMSGEEDVLDISERWPRFRIMDDGEIRRMPDREI